jgi:hypothetical protein
MTTKISADEFVRELRAHESAEELEKYQRYFKFDKDDQREDDYFIGVRMGQVFALAKQYMDMDPDQIEALLDSPIHEVRAGAVSIMDWQARSKKTPDTRRRELFELYILRHDRINDWDLVDRSAPHVVGGYLADKRRDILYELARSETLWERRTAIVSTAFFVRRGDLDKATEKSVGTVGTDRSSSRQEEEVLAEPFLLVARRRPGATTSAQ